MFNFFSDLTDTPDDISLFISHDGNITKKQFCIELSRYIGVLSNIHNKTVGLYIPHNVYLFYNLFSALLCAGKDVILLSHLSSDNVQPLSELTNTIITDQKVDIPNFDCFLPDPSPTIAKIEEKSDPQIYFFTSGSTSQPKCIKKSLISLLAEVYMHSQMQYEIIKQKPTVIASVVPFHMYGMLWRFLFSLHNNLIQDLDTIFYPEEFLSKQAQYNKLLFITTPSFMGEIVSYPEQYTFSQNCICIYSSGSLLTQSLSEKIKKILGATPYEIYGSTETGGIAFRQQDRNSVWSVFPGVNISVNEKTALLVSSNFSISSPYEMGDSVQLIDDNHFILNGRLNRLVKIAEKRVSLPEIESYLETCGYIKSAYFTTYILNEQRISLAAIVTLTDLGKKYVLDNGKSTLIMEIRKFLNKSYDNSFLPKKIRIVEKLPTTSQGKILQSTIKNILNSKLQEPITFDLHYDQFEFSANLAFEKSSEYFNGHFPGFPILPGVIQLHFVFYYIKLYFHDEFKKYAIHKLKFSNLIMPNVVVHLTVKKLSDTDYSFIYEANGKVFSSGRIIKEE